jgi:hypothetical protein
MVVAFDGCDVRRFKIKFMKALSRKKRAEEIQKRYSRMWRYSRGILSRFKSLHRNSRNIVID